MISFLTSLYLVALLLLTYILSLIWSIIIRPSLSEVSRLPGPKRQSFIWGCMAEVFRSWPGVWHEAQLKKYGPTFSYKGFMNTNRLVIVDTKALSHVFARSDIYQKPPQVRQGLGRVLGLGLLFAEGDAHKRQRKIMNPSFSISHIRSLLPVFYDTAEHVRSNWMDLLQKAVPEKSPYSPSNANEKPEPRIIVNVLDHMSRFTLDIIGTAGFDYAFDSLSSVGEGIHSDNELSRAFATVLNHPDSSYGVWDIIVNWFPILFWVPTKKERRISKAVRTVRRIGYQLIAQKKAAILEDILTESAPSVKDSKSPSDVNSKPYISPSDLASTVGKESVKGRDLLSLLIRANMARDLPAKERLTDEDVLSQITTFVAAGHETTSTAIAWTWLALANHPDVQEKLREECLSVGERPSLDVLEGMKYMDAVVRESLRWNTIAPSTIRICTKDDPLPLSDGRVIRVKKGDGVFVPIAVINRWKDYWGDDATEFKPSRWLDGSTAGAKQIPGVYSDILTFIGGPRSCIGVKFAVIEMKVALHTLLSTFRFAKANPSDEVIPRTTIVTRPMIKGRESEGNMLPMGITLVEN